MLSFCIISQHAQNFAADKCKKNLAYSAIPMTCTNVRRISFVPLASDVVVGIPLCPLAYPVVGFKP